jgi:hypothetical protein
LHTLHPPVQDLPDLIQEAQDLGWSRKILS